jgi:hypothetical protein
MEAGKSQVLAKDAFKYPSIRKDEEVYSSIPSVHIVLPSVSTKRNTQEAITCGG